MRRARFHRLASPWKHIRGTRRWANITLRSHKYNAKRGGYAPLTITADELVAWHASHNKQCDICGTHEQTLQRGLNLDHNHRTGTPRGWLCGNCNTMIGKAGECEVILERAIEYLRLNGSALHDT